VNLLDLYIEDKRIINLISQFIENGLFDKAYIDHETGIHQGDILSPLLSNIYLNQFDFLEREEVEFVRFADDFVLFFKDFDEAKVKSEKAREFVKTLGLDFEIQKSYFSNIEKGFSFLGCFFKDKEVYIDKERFKKHIQTIKELKKLDLRNFLDKLVLKYKGFKNYYFKSKVFSYKRGAWGEYFVFALNKSDDIKVGNDGRLTKEARKRIIEEVNERFASLHEYRGEKRKMEDIIELQAFSLAKAINENKICIGFKAKF
jgi:hypothetical protein